MSYPTFPPPYGTYQTSPAAPYTPYQSGHYPTQYPQAPVAAPAHPVHESVPTKSTPPPEIPPPPPDLSSVTPQVASQAIQRLLSLELRDVEFDAAQPLALQRLEHAVIACQFNEARTRDVLLTFPVL